MFILLIIYEALSNDNILLRCVDGFNPNNNNENFNQLAWKISPKTLNSYSIIVEIAACVFNEDWLALLIIINALRINCGPNAHKYTEKLILSM